VPRLARRARQVVEFAARADGVPFMVEELLAAALSSGRWLPRPNRGGSASVPSRWFPAAAVLGASVDDGETITDRIAAWARLLPYDHSPAARRIGDRVPQHDGRTCSAQLWIRPGNSAFFDEEVRVVVPGAGLITAHDAGVKPSVRRVVAVRCGVRQAVWEFEGDARRRLVVEADCERNASMRAPFDRWAMIRISIWL
jgi:hypothetical protein